jgi:hypothetical protein
MTTLFKDVNEHNILDGLLSTETHTIQVTMIFYYEEKYM